MNDRITIGIAAVLLSASLAAAGGIFVGHGGDLALERTSGERLVFRAKLPRT